MPVRQRQNKVLYLLCSSLGDKKRFGWRDDVQKFLVVSISHWLTGHSATVKSLMSQKEVPHGSQGRGPAKVCVVWQGVVNMNRERETGDQ